ARAVEHLSLVTALANQSKDHLLHDIALLLKSDLLQESGQIPESLAILRELAPSIPRQAPDFVAQYEQVLACAMLRTGQEAAADSHRRRADRTYASLQHHVGQMELARAWQDATANKPEEHRGSIAAVHSPATILSGVAS